MYCSNCGREIADSAKHCMYCGHRVVPLSDNTGRGETMYTDDEYTAPIGYEDPRNAGARSASGGLSPASKAVIVLAIILLAMVMFAAGSFLMGGSKKTGSTANGTAENGNGDSSGGAEVAEATTQAAATTTQAAATTTQAAATTTQAAATNNYYILPDSSSRYLTKKDISDLDTTTLKRARNEIYARRHRRFDDADLQRYFNSQAWYSGTIEPGDFEEDSLNDYEKKNAEYIKKYEKGGVLEESADPNVTGTVMEDAYILPQSSERKLEESDLYGLNADDLKKARNEIYARYGRMFNDTSLQNYFNEQSWYNGTIEPDAFKESWLNEYEKYNVDFIKQHE